MNPPEIHDQNPEILMATWWIGEALFGLDTDRVQEVVRPTEITPVHHAPDDVLGVMNLRGRIVTVVDPGLRLDLGKRELTSGSRIFIVNWMGEAVGLVADAVEDAVTIERTAIQKAPENVRGVQGQQLLGVCRLGERVVALLDIDRVLGDLEDSTTRSGRT